MDSEHFCYWDKPYKQLCERHDLQDIKVEEKDKEELIRLYFKELVQALKDLILRSEKFNLVVETISSGSTAPDRAYVRKIEML